MAVTLLGRLASRAAIPVFPVVGFGARPHVQDLVLNPQLAIASSPRHASVLLIAGEMPSSLDEPMARAHDQMPHPRATVVWDGDPRRLRDDFPFATWIPAGDPVSTLVDVFRALVTGARESDPTLLPDQPPAPWKDVGPHGQGGEGMTGGKPYGRPMPEMGHARDGLMLDDVSLRVGPFFPAFPPGLALDVTMQGDVVEGASMAPNPFASFRSRRGQGSIFERAAREPVPIAELESARAEHHLRLLSHALGVLGLEGASRALLRLARGPSLGRGAQVRRLGSIPRTGLRWAVRDVGALDAGLLRGRRLGWIARASGSPEDARADDPAYRSLGFEMITTGRGDALARFDQLFHEAKQSLELAQRAGDTTTSAELVEGPHGRVGGAASAQLLSMIPSAIEGLEWADAITTIMSLGIDLEDAGTAARADDLR